MKLKITCVIHSLGIGGMERVMSILLNDFAQRENVNVDLVLIGRKREVFYDLPEAIKIHKPNFVFDNKKRNYHTLKTMSFLRKTLKQLKPDCILGFGEFWNNLLLLSAIGLPYPIFISDRSQPNKDLGKFHNRLRNMLYPRAAGFIAQTNFAAENAHKNGWNTNITTIGNPIKQINALSSVEKREKIILSVGRLISTKHFDDLIKMFVDLDQSSWKLVIVGGNAKRQDQLSELKKQVKDLKAEDKVELTGEIKNVEDYYRKASIFAFTSSSEGFPNVVGEALAHGLPVVSYDCMAGPADLIEEGKNGFLVQTHDHQKFKEKLSRLMNDNSLLTSLSKNTRAKVDEFQEKKIADRFFSFITNKKN